MSVLEFVQQVKISGTSDDVHYCVFAAIDRLGWMQDKKFQRFMAELDALAHQAGVTPTLKGGETEGLL